MIFTKTDKVLLDRAARHMANAAEGLKSVHGPVWSASKAGCEAKKVYDRLLRDERDLRALAKRLEQDAPTIEFPAGGAVAPQTSLPLTASDIG